MYVRLTCKLAEFMEGVDLTAHAEGNVMDLSEHDANLLIKGGWAEHVDDRRVNCTPTWRSDVAADRSS